ncbi:protein HAPLESS 2 isoform X2 [Amaranthus tricolor]|uniref:protein HAPLESS 2 isoform X2 n=1 Tax=Amaranthus tricolor TaxID=29722 RepID=UPI0025847E51|nr:protein HAPLESS 2 isoform X2 [Amaranthus tricolor]
MGNLRNILVCGRIMQNVKGKLILLFLLLNLVAHNYDCDDGFGFGFGFGEAVQILSKSRLEKCEKSSTDGNGNGNLNCSHKILINIAVPSKSSGGEASMVAEVAEVEENSTDKMRTLRQPPVVTVNKSPAYAVFDLTYIRDVPYKPEEYFVQTRKCEPDADAQVVKICERLRDEQGHIIEPSQPICCPCGDRRRVPSSCGNFFDKLVKGKANTAHCLRFPGVWFHVFGIGQRNVGFSVRIEVKTGSSISEVVISPGNRTAVSSNNFLRVNLIGDFGGYTNIPSFEDFYLVIPREHGPGEPPDLGRNFSMWMLLERVRFTLDGLECNKVGVSYEAFNGQPDFCTSPYWSCLHNQLWNFYDADQNRIARNQPPLYGLVGRFERINEHPGAGPRSFSFGITESLNTDLLIELAADDIEYVYKRSPGKILGITVPTFEALAQFGIAEIKTQNIGAVEASYSLTFKCSEGVIMMEEQFVIMKPQEIATRSFKIFPTTDQALKYVCSAILKDSEYAEIDRAECQFTTTATVLDNGTQGMPFQPPKTDRASFFETIKDLWKKFWSGLSDFITGKTCSKCTGFFDFHCHIQYVCISWVIMFGLFLSIFPTVLVLLWLLHQKGLFDPLYDWWEDNCWEGEPRHKRHRIELEHHNIHHKKHRAHHHGAHHHHHNMHGAHHHHRKNQDVKCRHTKNHGELDHHHAAHRLNNDYEQFLHRVHKDKHKHRKHRTDGRVIEQLQSDCKQDGVRHHRHRKEKRIIKRTSEFQIYDNDDVHEPNKDERHLFDSI